MGAVIAIGVLLVLIAVAIWSARTPPSSGNGDNGDAARRYGAGS